jgi:CDP-diacylglycerol---glycerol-3-phosphate 3-phosphatidyltransferase
MIIPGTLQPFGLNATFSSCFLAQKVHGNSTMDRQVLGCVILANPILIFVKDWHMALVNNPALELQLINSLAGMSSYKTPEGIMHLRSLTALTNLRRRWAVYLAISFLIVMLFHRLFTEIQGSAYALRWALLASAMLLIQLVSLWKILPLNHRQGETALLPRFGPGNLLTLARGTIIALLVGFLFIDQLPGMWAWLPVSLYFLSDLTDFFDGYLARVSGMVTRLGETLDMNSDALGVLVATLLAYQYGTVPWWYLPFGFARYIFLLGLFIHQRKELPLYPMKPSSTRRLFAGVQMGFITVMLMPVLGPPGTSFAATVFLLPFLTIFLIDYLDVTGQKEHYSFWAGWNMERIKSWSLDRAPLLLRGLCIIIYGYQALVFSGVLTGGVSLPEGGRLVFLILSLLFMIAFGAGILGRVFAIAGLIAAGIQLQWLVFSFEYWLLVFALIYILLAGAGKFTLFSPEEWLVHNRPGEKEIP